MINVCIFEDSGFQNLYPLTFTRPAYDLRIGIDSLYEKVLRFFGQANITLQCRDYLKSVLKEKYQEIPINNINTGSACLFINGRVWMTDSLFDYLTEIDESHDHLFISKGEVIAAFLKGDQLETMRRLLKSIPGGHDIINKIRPSCIAKELDDVVMFNHLWDLVIHNSEAIRSDFAYFNQPGIIKGEIRPFAAIYNENEVFVDKNTFIEDFVVLNAENGPIYIESDVYIEAGSRLEGPLFIGKGSRILGGKLKGSSIGNNCKVCGEVTDSVFLGYANKAHAGFIGNSYIGEWVNLGAHTTNSNLKNTYGNVQLEIENQKVDTGQTFLGSFIGDHVKTGIGTLLNTGTVIGYGTTIYGAQLHDKYIPAFSWGEPGAYQKHMLNKFFSTAEKVKQRRNIELSEADREVITTLYYHQTEKTDRSE